MKKQRVAGMPHYLSGNLGIRLTEPERDFNSEGLQGAAPGPVVTGEFRIALGLL